MTSDDLQALAAFLDALNLAATTYRVALKLPYEGIKLECVADDSPISTYDIDVHPGGGALALTYSSVTTSGSAPESPA